jgi:Zn ribbon nucleic-acid-binding protein
MSRIARTILILLLMGAPAAGLARAGEEGWMPSKAQARLSAQLDLVRWETTDALGQIIELPTGKGNAAAQYARLEELFAEERLPESAAVPTDAEGLQLILEAAAIRNCSLVPEYYEPMTARHPRALPGVVVLAYTSALMKRAEEAERALDFAAAQRLYRAGLVMGWHLSQDRPNLAVFTLGLMVQGKVVGAYEEYLVRQTQTDEARLCSSYRKALTKLVKETSYKSRILLGRLEKFRSLAACIKCATQDEDAMWRQEAVVNLGLLQNGYPNEDATEWTTDPVQQEAARTTLASVARNDPEATVRKLATWCRREMTPENIRRWQEEGAEE